MKNLWSIIICAAAAASLYGAKPALQWSNGIGKNLSNRSVVCQTALKGENTVKSFMILMPDKKTVRIETGRGQEGLTLQRSGETVTWSWRSADGTILRPNRSYYPNGTFQDSFRKIASVELFHLRQIPPGSHYRVPQNFPGEPAGKITDIF